MGFASAGISAGRQIRGLAWAKSERAHVDAAPVSHRADRTVQIAHAVRRFDLHDLRAHVGEHGARERPRYGLPRVDDRDPCAEEDTRIIGKYRVQSRCPKWQPVRGTRIYMRISQSESGTTTHRPAAPGAPPAQRPRPAADSRAAAAAAAAPSPLREPGAKFRCPVADRILIMLYQYGQVSSVCESRGTHTHTHRASPAARLQPCRRPANPRVHGELEQLDQAAGSSPQLARPQSPANSPKLRVQAPRLKVQPGTSITLPMQPVRGSVTVPAVVPASRRVTAQILK
eukprot:SAG31_NODE_789_length_12087_cov_5.727227_2_plen_286_part_00